MVMLIYPCNFNKLRGVAMYHVKDHKQLNIFDPWDLLGPKRRKMLKASWAGLFILLQLPVASLRKHYYDS